MNEAHAAEVGRGCESSNVADHSATDRDDHRMSIGAGARQFPVYALHRFQIFRVLGIIYKDRAVLPRSPESSRDSRAAMRPDAPRSDDEDPRAIIEPREQWPEAAKRTAAADDWIGARTRTNGDGFHSFGMNVAQFVHALFATNWYRRRPSEVAFADRRWWRGLHGRRCRCSWR